MYYISGTMATRQEILDEALKFLATHGAKGNSFDYYDKRRAEWNGYKEYLFKYLDEQFGIKEEEGLSIINSLYADKLIDAVWEPVEDQNKGLSPNQIKITYKGQIKVDAAKLLEMQKPENIEARSIETTTLQKEVLILQKREFKNKWWIDLIYFLSGIVVTWGGIYLNSMLSAKPEGYIKKVELNVSVPQLKIDTTYTLSPDTLSQKK